MLVKRYTGKDLKDALAKVKAELGPEAVLIKSQNLRSGHGVEVQVAVENHRDLGGPGDQELNNRLCLGRIQEDLAHIRGLLTVASAKQAIPAVVRTNSQLRLFFERLVAVGVEEVLALELIQALLGRLQGRALGQAETARQGLVEVLRENLVVAPAPQRFPLRLALVGPTGGGKTTTLAKLAALFSLGQGRSTALITVDNYRLAAAEQIAAYARLLGLPLTVAFNREELRQALLSYQDKEVILLDTAGRSHNHLLNMNELKLLLREFKNLERWLVLPASMKDQDMAALTRRYLDLGLTGQVFTKLDETGRHGNLINQVLRFKLPVTYLTAGQKVPEDIEPASQERLLKLVLNGTAGQME